MTCIRAAWGCLTLRGNGPGQGSKRATRSCGSSRAAPSGPSHWSTPRSARISPSARVRRLIADEFTRAFEGVDLLVTPTSPFPAFRRGEKTSDPLAMYAADVDTVAVNLAGLPALSVPAGFEMVDGVRLPVGVQFIAPLQADDRLYNAAAALERLLHDRWGGPLVPPLVTSEVSA